MVEGSHGGELFRRARHPTDGVGGVSALDAFFDEPTGQ
jgi:hypothetical protein